MATSKLKQSRRGFLSGVAAAPLLAAGPAAGQAPASTTALAAPQNLLALYRVMRGGSEADAALWWLTGTLFGKLIDQTNVPLLQVHGASWNRISMRDDGNLDQSMDEAGYFADRDSGAILETWINPMNGHEARPEPYRTRSRVVITPTAVERPQAPIAVRGRMGPAIVSGAVVWVPEIFSATVPASMTGGKPRIVESMATFQAQAADVDLAASRYVPCTLFFQEVDPFYPWMGIPEDTPGLLIWHVVGRKLRSPAEVPTLLAERLAADHPGFLTSPQV